MVGKLIFLSLKIAISKVLGSFLKSASPKTANPQISVINSQSANFYKILHNYVSKLS
jgi:hypothetical protein